jgi:hypothetical protein
MQALRPTSARLRVMLAALVLGHSCAAGDGLYRLAGAFSTLPVEQTVSFELGGVPSAALLAGWNSTTESYPLRGRGNRTRVRTVYFQPTIAPVVAGKPVDTSACNVSSEPRLVLCTPHRCAVYCGLRAEEQLVLMRLYLCC